MIIGHPSICFSKALISQFTCEYIYPLLNIVFTYFKFTLLLLYL